MSEKTRSPGDPVRRARLKIAPPVEAALAETIAEAGGREVFFLGRVQWDGDGSTAVLVEAEALAQGNRVSVPAVVERAEEWDIALHNHPSGDLEPSDADVAVAAELAERSVGFAIISSDARRHLLVVAPSRPRERQLLDPQEIGELLGPSGPLAAALEGFKSRPGQVEMALQVARALDGDLVVACEAGTGVGKSFAYLVPAILWAVRNRSRVVVSTGTINLQEQLVHRDLPFLERVLPEPFRYALIKGRSNYACRRKLVELPGELEIVPESPEDQRQIEDLMAWAETTADGSRSDLAWVPPPEIWERVQSETDKSLKIKCPFYQDCFYYQAKREAFKAHIVVVNHHLLFSDLAVRLRTGSYGRDLILPRYERVIFDEAHHLEDVASEHLGFEFSQAGIRARLGRMQSRDGKRGALVVLARRLRALGDARAARSLEERYAPGVQEIAGEIDGHLALLGDLVAGGQPAGGRSDPETGRNPPLRLRDGAGDPALWEGLREGLGAVRRELESLVDLNDRALESVALSPVPEAQKAGLRLELESFGRRLEELIGDMGRFTDGADRSLVRWLFTRPRGEGGGASLGFAAAPVRVGEVLRAALFDPMRTVVLTSATLSVAGRLDFLEERLGLADLERERFQFSRHASPFRFEEQVLLVVPGDMPPPGASGFEEALAGAVHAVVRATQGRAFVLFTSYRLLGRMYERLEGPLRGLGCRPLAQGEAQRSELLDRFCKGQSCVLFGTDSFWEGVDVKGEALSCVVLTRLPFRVPSEPLQEARFEDVRERGGDPFMSYALPQAVLRFKQGFGRLVRSETDRGVVAVLDSRILTRRYGRVFLESLPRLRLERGSLSDVVREVEAFFAREEPARPAAVIAPRDPALPGRVRREPAPGGGSDAVSRPRPGARPPPW